MRWGFVLGILVQALGLTACGDCSDEIEAAKAYVADPANLACASDADCEVVGTGCQTFERGLCGQSNLNKSAAGSKQWSELFADLVDCDEVDTCATCDAALGPHCDNGFCGG